MREVREVVMVKRDNKNRRLFYKVSVKIMNSSYNYENRPTNAQMKTQYNIQYGLNHTAATIKAAWNSLTLLQKIVLVGIFALAIYFIIKLIKQQRKWAAIASSQTEPVFLKDLEWDSAAKKVYIGNKPLDVIPGSKLVAGPNNEYTYSFWIFMNSHNPFVPGADGAKGAANISERAYANKVNNLFFRGAGEYKAGIDNDLSPGVWFGGQSNDQLLLEFRLVNGENEIITVDDVAVNEWVNVTFTVAGKVVNIYINGKLERSVMLSMAAKQPGKGFGLYVGHVDKGFPGEMAYLQYYASALESRKIEDIYAYYKRKLDEFMENVNYWIINGKVVPAVPTNLECIPVDDSESGSGSGNGTDGGEGGIGGLFASMKAEVSGAMKTGESDVKGFKTDLTADGNGTSSGDGTSVFGDLKEDVSSMKSRMMSDKGSATKKLDGWESEFKSYHL